MSSWPSGTQQFASVSPGSLGYRCHSEFENLFPRNKFASGNVPRLANLFPGLYNIPSSKRPGKRAGEESRGREQGRLYTETVEQ